MLRVATLLTLTINKGGFIVALHTSAGDHYYCHIDNDYFTLTLHAIHCVETTTLLATPPVYLSSLHGHFSSSSSPESIPIYFQILAGMQQIATPCSNTSGRLNVMLYISLKAMSLHKFAANVQYVRHLI